MSLATQDVDLAPKKRPVQERSRATFEALVDACALLLPERGYAGTSTNHVAARAGVNIASLYEYFPGKDAIVAQVAERLVDHVAKGGVEVGADGGQRLEHGVERDHVLVDRVRRVQRSLGGTAHDPVGRVEDLLQVAAELALLILHLHARRLALHRGEVGGVVVEPLAGEEVVNHHERS